MRPGYAFSLIVAALAAAAEQAVAAQQGSTAARDSIFHRFLDYGSMVRGGAIEPHWLADGSRFWFAEGSPDAIVITQVDPLSGSDTPLFDVTRLRASLAGALGHEPPSRGLPFDRFTFEPGERAARFTVDSRAFRLDLSTYAVTPVTSPTAAERLRTEPQMIRAGFPTTGPDPYEVPSPDGQWLASERDHNLSLRSTRDGRAELLTTDGAPDYAWSVGGALWSPNATTIAAFKTDERRVALVPLLHWLKPTEEVEWVHLTRTGGALARTELFLIDVLAKKPWHVDTGEGDYFLSPIGWRPDGSEYLFYRMRRDYKRLDVMAADRVTGRSRIVLTETQPTFIKGISLNPGWSELYTPVDSAGRFVWQSERDGWDHLYLYDKDGALIRRLTRGRFPVIRVVAVDEAKGWVYFTAHAEPSPYDTHLYRVGLGGEGFVRLTEASGQHSIAMSPSKAFFLDPHSTIDRPPVVELRRTDGKLLRTLSTASIDELVALHWKAPEEFVAKAADDTTNLYGVLFKPYDFDSTQTYPVIDFIYNGPQIAIVPRMFVGPGFPNAFGVQAQALAQCGFVVFMVDGRGTVERGKAFQDLVYRNFGRNEIPDHVAVLQQLARRRTYMDLSRVGITGSSWGGYMTVRAMVTAPEVYRVGVAGVPVVDIRDHITVMEPYMDLPQNDPEGYEYASSLRLAANLKGDLLMIAGTSDLNAPFSATMKMVDALTRAGKQYSLIVLPEQNHITAGQSRAYRTEATRRFFEAHLLPRR